MASDQFTSPPPPIGVIESLTSGFELVAGKLPLLIIPVLLDLFLWMGPRVSYSELAMFIEKEFLIPQLRISNQDQRAEVGASIKYVKDRFLSDWLAFDRFYMPAPKMPGVINLPESKGRLFDTFDLLAFMVFISAPVGWFLLPVFANRPSGGLPFDFYTTTFSIATPLDWFLCSLIGCSISLLFWGFYVATVGESVKTGKTQLSSIIRVILIIVPQIAVANIVFVSIYLIGLTVIFIGVTGVLVMIIGPDATLFVIQILGVFALTISLLIGMLLAFTLHGMILNSRHILAAIWDSIRVVQWNMSSTFGLFLLIMIITIAMRYVWILANPSSWVSVAAIGGNAFINTGLMAATFIFFKDRHRYWRALRDEILAELERRRAQQGSGSQSA
jgi:hypothetical protein